MEGTRHIERGMAKDFPSPLTEPLEGDELKRECLVTLMNCTCSCSHPFLIVRILICSVNDMFEI